ncbi:hypothetical protein BCR39DRAFT_534288 [Naematelia encephala]|uniref:HD/PDEase domain-containing protein n=1 Tax=Naematelia encephala TaxID=71784 RepID=A0A1Y2B1I2_9TREE|nr:hypothetical protein BCR39DRAFT_534288 [Naematelia encephala]
MSHRQETIRAAEELVKAHMARYDPSHDWHHVNRVRNTAIRIASSLDPRPDLLVVELAALFHDLTDSKYDPNLPLEEVLLTFLKNPSTEFTLSASQLGLVLMIVPNVSWSKETKLRAADLWKGWYETCVELHCVQDADRLDAIGAIGLLRCAAYSGAKGVRLLYEGGHEGRRDDSAEGHFEEKLLKVRDRMKTIPGRDEAESRHTTVRAFEKSPIMC